MSKCEFPIDKREWSPSLIPGGIVLISSVSADGEPNVAPKSWVQMVAFDPPTLMFAGSKDGATENYIEATGEFAVNIVSDALLPSVLACVKRRGRERIEHAGWILTPARKIAAPLVADCPANLECKLVEVHTIGSSLVIFGRIVAGSIDQRIAEAPADEKYGLLRQVCFLEDGVYAVIDETNIRASGEFP